jgi:hypothetical protein
MKVLKSLAAAAAMVALSGTAQAALVSQDNGTVRDTNTNLIWLQNWNVNGLANWGRQKRWAENLSFAGSNEWRLPEISEYGALFTAYGDLTKVAEFSNVDTVGYWSGTEYAPDPTEAWYFFAANGSPFFDPKSPQLFAVAVRPGDAAAPVPEPQTLALVLLALGATMVVRRRRPA